MLDILTICPPQDGLRPCFAINVLYFGAVKKSAKYLALF